MWKSKSKGKRQEKNNYFYLNKITGFFYDHTFFHNFCCYNNNFYLNKITGFFFFFFLMITHFAIIFVVTIWWYVKLWFVTKCNFSHIFFQIIFFFPFIITHFKIVTICNTSCVHRLSDKIILIVMFMSHSMSIEGKILLTSELKRQNVLVDLV